MNQSPATFDITGSLPEGTTLLQASAGTGKTYTIAALATRFLAEGLCTVNQLLLITFGRAAAQELRHRVRTRLVDTAAALAPANQHNADDDPIVALLRVGDEELVSSRRARLLDALAAFDEATIDTTHAFCERVLRDLGISSDSDPAATLTEDLSSWINEVASDWYVNRYGRVRPEDATAAPARLTWSQTIELANVIAHDPQATVFERCTTTADTADDGVGTDAHKLERLMAAERVHFAQDFRQLLAQRLRESGRTTFDDLLQRVSNAVRDRVTGPVARDRLRGQYPVVMVDEFQDTDPLQWSILHQVFHEHSRLILIGDPKQAIYAFRGGDIETYQSVAKIAHHRATLGVNHRTDAALVSSITKLFGGVELGDGITVDSVEAHHQQPRLHGYPHLQLRTVPDDGAAKPAVAPVRAEVVRDVTDVTIDLLSSGVTLSVPELSGAELNSAGPPTTDLTSTDPRRVRPADIAVLVFDNSQANAVHESMRAAGVAAVISGNDNVYASEAAVHWVALLQAMEHPNRPHYVRAAMLSVFFGYTGTDLGRDGDAAVNEAAQLLREWIANFRVSGIAGVVRSALPQMAPRVLSGTQGERTLTDVIHIGEDLHALGSGVGAAGLVQWLTDQRNQAATEIDERARRLDTDADAVQIITIHKSKGLEFPIVLVPFAWNLHRRTANTLRFHDDQGRRMLDLGGCKDDWWRRHEQLQRREDDSEHLRLLYVALTRASSAATVWWARTGRNTECAPLQRLVGARVAGTIHAEARYLTSEVALPQVETIFGQAAQVARAQALRWDPTPVVAGANLRVAPFTRSIDTAWRRTSYSALTAAAHQRVDLPDQTAGPDASDEPQTRPSRQEPSVDVPSEETCAATSPLAALPVGAAFGVLVHRVYELFDASAPNLTTELLRCSLAACQESPVPGVSAHDLATALEPSVRTGMGPLSDGRCLADLTPLDRLAELEFELPLAGDDRRATRGSTPTLDAIGNLIRIHLDAADPLSAYPDRMYADGLIHQKLSGFLVGSIDAVFRVGTPASPRFVIADYKTNWLGGSIPDGRLSVSEYSPEAMARAMIEAHYPLQALLYQVALHRYLRWRQPGYTPTRHLGGALYLFVRGMGGPGGASSTGVFSWKPPTALITELSDLLAGAA